ncbi:MAG TPA: DUF4416 family protein [Persephonella sp.]|nr:DUF4416 family protein [Hydrogenothermaceae bacterium]HIQ24410.1 DUF4416 family protein [Persephonella sp.]
MWKEENKLKTVEKHLLKFYGNFVEETNPFSLPYCEYYTKEMGSPLYKKFVVTSFITEQKNLANIKKHCMFIEDKYKINGNRTVNIDPILLDTEKVLVATKKYRGNRIQIDKNLFLELELWFHNGSFQPFLWTYLDYKEYIPFFNKIRKGFKKLISC